MVCWDYLWVRISILECKYRHSLRNVQLSLAKLVQAIIMSRIGYYISDFWLFFGSSYSCRELQCDLELISSPQRLQTLPLHQAFLAFCRKMIREDGVDVFVELDVGSDYNTNDEQIRSVLYNVVKEGAIASYVTSVEGFQFRRLGEGKKSAKTGERRLSQPRCDWLF